jgi:hypothetical protein
MALACRKAKELGYPRELWTIRLLAAHTRQHGPSAGHPSLAKLAQGTVCKILAEQAVKPHKVRYCAIPSSSPRRPKSFVSTGKWRCCGGKRQRAKTAAVAGASRSSLTTRNLGSRRSARRRRIARHCPAPARRVVGQFETNSLDVACRLPICAFALQL